MVSAAAEKPLIAIVGPTGSGKSKLAVRLALELDGEIINCDSLQLYRYLDIGTAKLTPTERRGVPHHLLDVLNPDEYFSAGEFARRARQILYEISARGRLPILVGGTGFYLRALVEGLFPGPRRNEQLRAELKRRQLRRPGILHRWLRRRDPSAAARIHPHDVQKLTRAVEICLLTQRPLAAVFAAGRESLEGYRVLKLGLDPPREALYQMLDERCRQMFEGGLLDEVRRVLLLGFPPESKALEAHGYRQALQLLRGELNYKEALYYAQRNTRRYAKRQWTWFRREKDLEWIRGFGWEADVVELALERIRAFVQLSGSPAGS